MSATNQGGPYRHPAGADPGGEPPPPSWEDKLLQLRQRRQERRDRAHGELSAGSIGRTRPLHRFLRILAALAALQDKEQDD